MGDSWENQTHASLIERGLCPYFPCTKPTCQLKHFGQLQQVPMACVPFHFDLNGCTNIKDCKFTHHRTEEQRRRGPEDHCYIFAEPIRKISVEKDGIMETKYIDNRSTELWYFGKDLFNCKSWTRLNVCAEHFSGRTLQKNEQNVKYATPAATACSIQYYIDYKRDQSWNEVQADTPAEQMSVEFSCLYDHSVLPACGSIFLLKSDRDQSELVPREDLTLRIEPRLLEAFGGEFSMEWLPGDIEVDTAQWCLDSLAKDVKDYHIDNESVHYSFMGLDSAKRIVKDADLSIKEYLYQEQLEHDIRMQKKQEIEIEMLMKKHEILAKRRKLKIEAEQKAETTAGAAGSKRKCDEVNDPEPGPASVKKARSDEVSSPAEVSSSVEVLPKKASTPTPTAASAANALSPPAVPTPTVAGKRKRSRDDEQQSDEPAPNKKIRRDESGGAAIQSLVQKGLRRRFQRPRPTVAPTKPTSTTTAKKRARDEEEPSTPAATIPTKKRKRGGEDEELPGVDDSGSNKKKLRVSTAGNGPSDSATASLNLSPVFSEGHSPASSASDAPSPPSLDPSPREVVPPKSSPAAIPPHAGASKGESPTPVATNADAAKGTSSTLPATSKFPPMPKCPSGVVPMSQEEYRKKITIYAKLKRDNAPAEERRRVRDDIEQSLKSRGLDQPDPAARARIYGSSRRGGPSWDPC